MKQDLPFFYHCIEPTQTSWLSHESLHYGQKYGMYLVPESLNQRLKA